MLRFLFRRRVIAVLVIVGLIALSFYWVSKRGHRSAHSAARALIAVEMPEGAATSDTDGSREIATQAALISATSTILELMQDPVVNKSPWFEQFKGTEPDNRAADALHEACKVSIVPNTSLIEVKVDVPSQDDAIFLTNAICDQAVARSVNTDRTRNEQKMALLSRGSRLIGIELEQEVLKQLHERENSLGLDQVGTSLNWNGKQFQLDRLLNEQARIRSELSGFESRHQSLVRDLEAGRTPPEVEGKIREDARYTKLRARFDDADLELQLQTLQKSEKDPAVAMLKEQRKLLEQRLNDVREDLKSTFADTMKSMLQNEIDAASANSARVEEIIMKISGDLSRLNQAMSEYRTLLDRKEELRKKQAFLSDEIARIQQFEINKPWGRLRIATRAEPVK